MKSTRYTGLVLLFALLLLSGCGSSYPNVSGKVTINGQPVEGLSVLFIPVSTEQDPFPGPYAEGVTDSSGNYVLKTRDGSKGGVPGVNIVELYSGGAIKLDLMESDALLLLAQAGGDKDHPSYKKSQELSKQIKSLKAKMAGGKMRPTVKTEFTIPPEGTDKADFELIGMDESSN